MAKRDFRIECAVKRMQDRNPRADLHFLTLTTPDVCKPWQVAERWRNLVNSFYWRSLKMQYVQVVEWHPGGHGYHIHVVIDKYLYIRKFRPYAQRFGFGRIHILKCDTGKVEKMAHYLSKYLTKYRDESRGHKRTRFSNVSRGLTTLADIKVEDKAIDFSKAALEHIRRTSESVSAFRVLNAAQHVYMTFPYHSHDYMAEIGLPLDNQEDLLDFSRKHVNEFRDTHCKPCTDVLYSSPSDGLDKHTTRFTCHVLCDIKGKVTP